MSSAMTDLLLAVQIAVAVGVLLVLAIRRPIRRFLGARLAFGLWALPVVAGLAVLAPGPVQLVPSMDATGLAEMPRAEAVAPAPLPASEVARNMAQPVAEETIQPRPSAFTPSPVVWLIVWSFGVLAAAFVLGLRQYRFRALLHPLLPAPELGPDVFRAGSDKVGASLVGAARPKIIVPADFETRFSPAERQLILDHEREHRRAGHAQFNALAALVQVLCWMNPLVHLAMRWFRLDQELACDAAILQRSTRSARTYGAALLRAQTGVAAPFGCTWRPANGLKTRIQALGIAAPAGARRGLGAVGLAGLLLGVGAVSWAAHPNTQLEEFGDALLTDGDVSEPASDGSLRRILLRGVDARVQVIAETRDDIALEGLVGEALKRREGDRLLVQVSDLTRDVCNRSGPVSQDFTIRVPTGVVVDIEGRMDATLLAPGSVALQAAGCGEVDLGNVAGNLDLALGNGVIANGGTVAGALTVNTWGGPTLNLVSVEGPIEARTAGGTTIDIEAVEAGGLYALAGSSRLHVEAWTGPLRGGTSGGSQAVIEEISSERAEVSASGSASGHFETGQIAELIVDQSAGGRFFFGGQAEQSRVRNSGREAVVLRDPGRVDSSGRLQTVTDDPPSQ